MKRLAAVALGLAVIATFLAATPAEAAAPVIDVRFNGHPVLFDVEPVIFNGRTLVPFRAVVESMGAAVTYDPRSHTVMAERSGITVRMTIGSTVAQVNGKAVTIPDGVAPRLIQNRTFIPLRFLSESMGMKVVWEPVERIVNILDLAYPGRGGTLQLAMWSAPAGIFNPVMYTDEYDNNIVSLVFDGLWYFDGALRPRPSVARYWEISSDNREITFYLRRNVKFHDGRPLTSADVRFTFESITHPEYKGVRNVGYDALVGYEDWHAGRARHLAGIETPDAYTVRFKLKRPYAPFFTNNTGMDILPRHQYVNVPLADWGTSRDPHLQRPIGAGPFQLVSSASSQFYLLDAYEHYHLGRPYLDHVVYKVLAQDTALAQLGRSAVDAVDLAVSDLPTVRQISHVQVMEYPDLSYQYLGFNHKRAPFDDKRVRQAAAYAIDTRSLVHDLLEGHAGRIYTHMHPLYWSFTEEVERYDFNPARAEQLLEAAGWRRGPDGVRVRDGRRLEVELLYPIGNKVRERSAPVIQQWLQAVGFAVTLNRLEFRTVVERVYYERAFQVYLMGWGITADPDPKGIFDQSQIGAGLFNAFQWYNPRAQELMDLAVSTLDIEERRQYYIEWQQLFADELPLYPLYAANAITGIHRRVRNVKPSPAGHFWNIYEIYLER